MKIVYVIIKIVVDVVIISGNTTKGCIIIIINDVFIYIPKQKHRQYHTSCSQMPQTFGYKFVDIKNMTGAVEYPNQTNKPTP